MNIRTGCFNIIAKDRILVIVFLGFLFSSLQSNGQNYGYTGAVQTYTFTNDVCIKLKAWGAGGGIGGGDVAGNGGSGGAGAYAEGVFNVSSGDILQIYTGGGGGYGIAGSGNGGGVAGWGYGNGGRGGNAGSSGGSGAGGGGGGSSTVVLNGAVILVAGGGGGGGGCGCATIGANAGGGGQPGQVASPAGSDGPVNPCATPDGAQGNDRGGGDGGGGGGGGGGWNGGYGGGVTSQGGSDCGYGGGAGGGQGGNSLGTIVTIAAGIVPGNNADPALCVGCSTGSSVPSTTGGNGLVILIISNITLTTTAGNNGPLCPGANLNLSSFADAISFNWTGPNGFSSANQNPVKPAVTPADSGDYTLIVVDSIGCADTLSTLAVVHTNPTAGINPPDTLTCAATTVPVLAFSGITGSTYDWGGGIITDTNFVSAPGNYTVTVTDPAGCTASASVTVYQDLTAPVAGINPPDSLTCAVTTITLTATSNYTNSTYNWSDGTTGSTDNISAPGAYSVTVTASVNGCTASASATVIQVPGFTDTFSVSPANCFGEASGAINLTITGGTAPFVFSWSNGAITQNISNIASGNYSVTITDQNSCTGVINAIYVPQPTQISITLTPGVETCTNSNDAGITTTVTGGTPAYTFLWSDGATTQNESNLAPGSYTVTVTDSHNCTMQADTSITQPAPMVLDAALTNPSCASLPADGSISVTPSGSPSPYQYQWSNGTTTSTATNLAPGSYSVTVTDANNCTADSSFVLSYVYDFTVLASAPATINLGDSVSLSYTVTGNAGAYTGVWSPGFSLACTGCNPAVAYPVYTTLYQIEITDSAGCTATDTLTVTVIPDYSVFIPNVFTPNGDGNNDFFEVFGKKEIWKFFDIQIFNRIGEKVFESNDMNFKWEGTFKNEKLLPGVYVYQVRLVYLDNHTDKLYKGSLTLIR